MTGRREQNEMRPLGEDAIEIVLRNGLVAVIDAVDWPLVRNYKWRIQDASSVNSTHYYARTTIGPKVCRKILFMHRLISGAAQRQLVDHIDGDGLNNRRANLRIADRTQNNANYRIISGCVPFKGVTPSGDRFRARIRFGGRKIDCGTYLTPEEAARAYDDAALRFYGVFAATNAELVGLP